MRNNLLLLFTACFIASCTPVEVPGEKVFLEEFDCNEGPFAAALPREYTKLRKSAPLVSEKVIETQDWETYKAISRRLEFEGLAVTVITFTNGRPYLLSEVHVVTPRWQVTGPLRVGDSASVFFKRLGKGRVADGVWNISQLGPTELFLEVKGGKIAVITYACYTG